MLWLGLDSAVLPAIVARLSGRNRLPSIRGSTCGSFRILHWYGDPRIHLRRIVAFSYVRKLDAITRIRERTSHSSCFCHLQELVSKLWIL